MKSFEEIDIALENFLEKKIEDFEEAVEGLDESAEKLAASIDRKFAEIDSKSKKAEQPKTEGPKILENSGEYVDPNAKKKKKRFGTRDIILAALFGRDAF